MTAAIRLSCVGGTLSIRIGPMAGPRPAGLLLRRRDGKATFDVPLAWTSDGCATASIAVDALHGDGPLRWDVLLAQGNGACPPLCPLPPGGGERHFFKAQTGSVGLSAYLSDTLGSLVLFCAPTARHQRVVQAEDARAAFPRWLEELALEEDLVLFESFLGKAYAGNPRYIYEALRRIRPDLRCVWAYAGPAAIPGNPRRVARGSAEYYRVLATAKYRVNNIRFPVAGRKPETRYLQTWHGTPLKRLGYDIEVAGPEADARESFHQESRGWTTLLSANPFSTQTLRRAFRYAGHVLEAGYPLADPLAAATIDRDAIVAGLGLPAGRRFILYAPTWRDHRPVGHWRFAFDLQLDLHAVASALAPDQMLLVRGHHLVDTAGAGLDLPANVRDVSHVDDATDLCAVSDVLVTDYSSIFFDFAVTGRPILFYCHDLELYAGQVRGFYLDPATDLPGPIARTTPELVDMLATLPRVQAQYDDRYRAFRARFCALNDGHAARRVVEAVFADPASRPAAAAGRSPACA